MRKIRRKIRGVGESFLVCLGLVIIPILPRCCVVGLANFLGKATFVCSKRDREVGFANLDLVYGDTLSPEEKRDILCGSFSTFALLILDLFWFTIFIERRLKKYVVFDDSMKNFIENEPAIVFSAHFGNWEVLGQAVGLAGKPCTSLAMKLKNSFANKFLNWRRKIKGQLSVDRDGAIRKIMKVLRSETGRVAMLLDQNVLPEEGGEFVNFFGLPAPCSKVVETLISRTDAKVMLMHCLADKKGVYTAVSYPPIDFEKETSLSSGITQVVADKLEEMIRENPGKWLWSYKRWKYIPEGADKGKYPFYAEAYLKEN